MGVLYNKFLKFITRSNTENFIIFDFFQFKNGQFRKNHELYDFKEFSSEFEISENSPYI